MAEEMKGVAEVSADTETVAESKSSFDVLNGVDVSGFTEKKGKLSYLSWAYAWRELKKRYPDADYRVFENADGWIYFTDGKTAWVKVGVTVSGKEHTERLAITDAYNNALPLEKVTSVDAVNTIQRAVTKAIARHGLGLYIYAGEDLPEGDASEGGGNGNNVRRIEDAKPAERPKRPERQQKAPIDQANRAKATRNVILTTCSRNGLSLDDACEKLGVSWDEASLEDLSRVLSLVREMKPA